MYTQAYSRCNLYTHILHVHFTDIEAIAWLSQFVTGQAVNIAVKKIGI